MFRQLFFVVIILSISEVFATHQATTYTPEGPAYYDNLAYLATNAASAPPSNNLYVTANYFAFGILVTGWKSISSFTFEYSGDAEFERNYTISISTFIGSVPGNPMAPQEITLSVTSQEAASKTFKTVTSDFSGVSLSSTSVYIIRITLDDVATLSEAQPLLRRCTLPSATNLVYAVAPGDDYWVENDQDSTFAYDIVGQSEPNVNVMIKEGVWYLTADSISGQSPSDIAALSDTDGLIADIAFYHYSAAPFTLNHFSVPARAGDYLIQNATITTFAINATIYWSSGSNGGTLTCPGLINLGETLANGLSNAAFNCGGHTFPAESYLEIEIDFVDLLHQVNNTLHDEFEEYAYEGRADFFGISYSGIDSYERYPNALKINGEAGFVPLAYQMNAECSCVNGGICAVDGVCVCPRDTTGEFCEILVSECFNGTVSECGKCECYHDFASGYWTGDACDSCASGFYGQQCNKFCNAADTCFGHGTCDGDGDCVCDLGYSGDNCEVSQKSMLDLRSLLGRAASV